MFNRGRRRGSAICLITVAALSIFIIVPVDQGLIRSDAAGAEAAGRGAPSTARADRILQHVQRSLSQNLPAAARSTRVPGGRRHVTLAMRDLVQSLPQLSTADRRTAQSLLARPTDGDADPGRNGYRVPAESHCDTNVCVHWVDRTEDAPPLRDRDGDKVPDWVQTNITVLEFVWDRVVTDYGYRAPLSDQTSANHGPDERLDVYLTDLRVNMYGYCTSDDPKRERRRSVSAYCVLDNDFSRAEFPGRPMNNLRATAAHEFFHAVQLGYDQREDKWLMEGTAVWIEDEVFDTINDHHQYFPRSALSHPEVPVDKGRRGYQYGAWVFWRFLAEYFGRKDPDPTVIRDVWSFADARGRAPDRHSLAAVVATMKARRVDFGAMFAAFGMTGHVAKQIYHEGARYPQAPIERSHVLARGSSVTQKSLRLNHLTNRTVAFVPSRGLRREWRLQVRLDLPHQRRGSVARFTVHRRNGSVRFFTAPVNRRGNGTFTLPFARARVAKVALTVTNASTRTRCWQRTTLACQGQPLDDALTSVYSARAVR